MYIYILNSPFHLKQPKKRRERERERDKIFETMAFKTLKIRQQRK